MGMDLRLEGSVKPIDLVVFDCDGVLLDTMPVKVRAFSDWVPEAHAAHREAFMSYIMRGFGRSRAVHVAHFYRELVGLDVDAEFMVQEIQRFAEICEPLCANAGWIAGSREFVEACATAGIPRVVLSGTPQSDLETMLEANGADGLFDEVNGSPPGKPEHLDRILSEFSVPAHRAVFVGDAEADLAAALHVGAHFVYVPSLAERPAGPVINEVTDLRQLLPG